MQTREMMTELDPTALTGVAGGDAVAPTAAPATVAFPSTAWFQHLADLMNANRARQEQLGYVDCVAGFRVLGESGSDARTFEVTFEEFSVVDVRESEDPTPPSQAARTPEADSGGDVPPPPCADFVLEATLATWREMIENVADGSGRPDLTHTLNYLSHPGTPLRLVSDDPLKADLYFRYNQSLQEFINASAAFVTEFPAK